MTERSRGRPHGRMIQAVCLSELYGTKPVKIIARIEPPAIEQGGVHFVGARFEDAGVDVEVGGTTVYRWESEKAPIANAVELAM